MLNKNKQKRVLLLWSGGLDSTAMICHYLSNGYAVDALPVTSKNSYDKNKREASAREAMMSAYFCDHPVNLLPGAEIYHATIGDACLSQASNWINAAINAVSTKHDEVAIGYVMNDDAVSFVLDFHKLWRAHHFLFKPHWTPLKFPMIKRQKHELYWGLPHVLRPLVTWCENPFDGDFCGNCTPCRKAIFVGIQPKKPDEKDIDDKVHEIGVDITRKVESRSPELIDDTVREIVADATRKVVDDLCANEVTGVRVFDGERGIDEHSQK